MWGYCLPHGEDIKPAVEEIIKDAHERGQKPFIVMLTDAQRVKLETIFPSEFNYEFSPENQEYVYLSEDLINLSGRKFHAKRNHISKFKNCYPDYRFEEITNKNIWKVCMLEPFDEQKDYVAENMQSLAEAYATRNEGNNALPLAVYNDDELIGFVMIGKQTASSHNSIATNNNGTIV